MSDRPPTPVAVRRAREVIETSYAALGGPEDIAAAVGLPLETLRKAFRRETGVAPWEYLDRVRVAEAKRLLAETNLRAYEVGLAVGWDREDSASRSFRRVAGTTMREYRQRVRSG